ncbi:MAG TPA: cysteine--tRNA ligase, partial [archaeon]|nr:cysteine--tRNA ligase [archaeon]
MLSLFNTMTRKKELFKAAEEVGIYFCGPTVYDYAHIGNFRSYIFSDLLRRYLEYKNYKVKLVMNITDVDDKTIKGAQKEKMTLREFTAKYENAFFEDVKTLRIKPADFYPRATEHIKEMAEIIRKLLEKGYAYIGDDNSVYYKIKKFKNYGKLSKLKISELKEGKSSSDEYEKEEAKDFALWKAYSSEDGDVHWQPEGLPKGRPGWHIECSAMAQKYLKSIDIHGGGVDLIFPHHENEIAQSTPAGGKNIKYWLHCEHLLVDGKKMSKSLGNFFTLRDLLDKGYNPLAIRFILLSAHYRSQMNFTFAALDSAKKTVDNINDFAEKIKAYKEKKNEKENEEMMLLADETKEKFEEAMDDDLNVPAALAALFDMMRTVNREIDAGRADKESLKKIEELMNDFNSVFDILYEKKELTEKEKE